MAVGDWTAIANEVKNNYTSKVLEDSVNLEDPYRRNLNKMTELEEGIGKFPLFLDAGWRGSRSMADLGSFPTAADPVRPLGTIEPVLFAGTVQIGFQGRYAAKTAKGTFNPGGILAQRIQDTLKITAKVIEKTYVGSVRGRLATVASDGSNNFVAAKPWGIENLEVGMYLDAFDALTSGTASGSYESQPVSAIARSTLTVTYTGSDRSLSAGDHMFIEDTYTQSPWGLADIVDDATLGQTSKFGQSTATYASLKALVLGNSGTMRDLTEQLILQAALRVRKRNGVKVNKFISNAGQALKFANFTAADRRYPTPTGVQNNTIGFESLPIVAPGVSGELAIHYDCPPRMLFGLDWSQFARYSARDLDWVDEDDSLLKLIPGSSTYTAGFHAYIASLENQFCYRPQGNFRIEDLNDSLVGDS
jgi:hypothetical protein